jgi:hypothetical protein
MILVLAVVLAALLAAVAGALGGFWLALHHFRFLRAYMLQVGKDAREVLHETQKARDAVEAADLPKVLDRVERIHVHTTRFIEVARAAERQAAETSARQQELEQAVAATFSIQLTRKD